MIHPTNIPLPVSYTSIFDVQTSLNKSMCEIDVQNLTKCSTYKSVDSTKHHNIFYHLLSNAAIHT